MNRKIKSILLIIVVVLMLPSLISMILLYGWISAQVEDRTTKNHIVEYVLENKNRIEVNDYELYQDFTFSYRGNITAYVEYGYYFSLNDTYQWHDEAYRDGFRTHGIPDERTDWCYNEKICDNWYYYEVHDG